jgi:hypothetical protein
MAAVGHIADRFARAEHAEHGVVKGFGALDVVRAEHDVVEHGIAFSGSRVGAV